MTTRNNAATESFVVQVTKTSMFSFCTKAGSREVSIIISGPDAVTEIQINGYF